MGNYIGSENEHVVGIAKNINAEIFEELKKCFIGECTEVGIYIAMSRQADREGFPEIAETFKRVAFEEAEHAGKFAEVIGETVSDCTQKNLEMRIAAEMGAYEGKKILSAKAKEFNLDAIYDIVHEMCKDEARHGKIFQGILKRYF